MVKQATNLELNLLSKGLITEASPLNFPAGATREEQNFTLNKDGTRQRRKGIDEFTAGDSNVATGDASPSLIDLYDSAVTFTWKNVAGDPLSSFLVVKSGSRIHFYDLNDFGTDNTVGSHVGTVNLSSTLTAAQWSFTAVNGYLIVATGAQEVYIITYTPGTPYGTFTYETTPIYTRDFWGMQTISAVENDDTYRPAYSDFTTTPYFWSHCYNLYNQSWGIPRKIATGTLVDPIPQFKAFEDSSRYASNSDSVWTGMAYVPATTTTAPQERMHDVYDDLIGQTGGGSKGYFIIDAINRGLSRRAAVQANYDKYNVLTSIPTPVSTYWLPPLDSTNIGPRVVANYAGRVFYAGMGGGINTPDSRSPDLTNHIFFSQTVLNKKSISKCYQEGDPTSRENSDIVDTDGGFIIVSGMGRVYDMVENGSKLIIFADNGIWAISGDSDYGFSATSYKVTKVSEIGAINKTSIVQFDSSIAYWAIDGIYVVSRDQFGTEVVSSISDGLIKSFYRDIGTSDALETARGVFDRGTNQLKWVYNPAFVFRDFFLSSGLNIRFTENSDVRELVFDLDLKAYSVNKIMPAVDLNMEVIGPVQIKKDYDNSFNTSNVVYLVIAAASISSAPYIKFANYKDTSFYDWPSASVSGGTDAYAYMQTGDVTGNVSSIQKQIPYLTMHFFKTESNTLDASGNIVNPSGCLFSVSWEWANSSAANKWTPLKQAYRYRKLLTNPGTAYGNYDYGHEIVTSRNKVRGRGRSFNLWLETEAGKDCQVLGWSFALNGNSIT